MQAAIHRNSSLSSLSPEQAKVIAALVEGATVTAAARDAGLHRTTIHNWLRSSPVFAATLNQARRERADQVADDLRHLAASALATVRSLLESESAPPSVRLRAALEVLKSAAVPSPMPVVPEIDLLVRAMQPGGEQDQREQVARNAPCPCGSGVKYKRCCGKDAPPFPPYSPATVRMPE